MHHAFLTSWNNRRKMALVKLTWIFVFRNISMWKQLSSRGSLCMWCIKHCISKKAFHKVRTKTHLNLLLTFSQIYCRFLVIISFCHYGSNAMQPTQKTMAWIPFLQEYISQYKRNELCQFKCRISLHCKSSQTTRIFNSNKNHS